MIFRSKIFIYYSCATFLSLVLLKWNVARPTTTNRSSMGKMIYECAPIPEKKYTIDHSGQVKVIQKNGELFIASEGKRSKGSIMKVVVDAGN